MIPKHSRLPFQNFAWVLLQLCSPALSTLVSATPIAVPVSKDPTSPEVTSGGKTGELHVLAPGTAAGFSITSTCEDTAFTEYQKNEFLSHPAELVARQSHNLILLPKVEGSPGKRRSREEGSPS